MNGHAFIEAEGGNDENSTEPAWWTASCECGHEYDSWIETGRPATELAELMSTAELANAHAEHILVLHRDERVTRAIGPELAEWKRHSDWHHTERGGVVRDILNALIAEREHAIQLEQALAELHPDCGMGAAS